MSSVSLSLFLPLSVTPCGTSNWPQKCQCGCWRCGSLIRAAVEWPLCRNLCAALFCALPHAIGGAHKSVAAGHLIIVIISIMASIIIIISIRSGNLVANWDANLVPVPLPLPPLSFSFSRTVAVRIFVAQFATQIINSKWKL